MPKPDKHILAIDLGTSGPKVAIATSKGQVLECVVEATKLELLPGGGAEQDPEDWWRAIKAAVRRLLDSDIVPVESIEAVVCTSQWAGIVPVSKEGEAISNAVIWMDSRGAKYIPAITGGLIKIEGYGVTKLATWIRKTGGIPSLAGKEPVAHILFLRNERPEVYQQAYKLLEPKDYLNARLTGRFAASYDSIALHWVTDNRDIGRIGYDEQLLAMATLERSKLPELKAAVDVLGPIKADVAAELGLREGTQVFMGTPDVQSAAVGSGAVRDLEPHIYIGTSSWVTCHVPFKKTDVFHNMGALPSAIPGRYFVANEQETSGACMAWLRDGLLCRDDALGDGSPPPEDVFERFGELAESVPAGSDKVIFTPWLYGERSPVANHSLRAGFHNLSLSTTRAHLIRAVMEGVAYNIRWLTGHVENFVGGPFREIRLIGGGAKSDTWCQIMADVLDRDILQVADPVEANVRGAALVAALGLGTVTVEEIAEQVPVARRYRPRAEHRSTYDELYAEFLNIYRRNKAIYGRLNRS